MDSAPLWSGIRSSVLLGDFIKYCGWVEPYKGENATIESML